MGTKNNKGDVRLPKLPEQYITKDGDKIKVLPYNFPRVSGVRTGGDKEFLKSNNGKLQILQR